MTLTTEELVKKAYHAGVVRWDVAKELVELIVQTEREAILDLVDAYAKNNTDLAEEIRARGDEAT